MHKAPQNVLNISWYTKDLVHGLNIAKKYWWERDFMCITAGVATCQGKVREKQNFLQVRELSGNFEKMSGNFDHLTNVREMSGNFVMTIKFF